MRHEKIMLVALAYVIGFTTAFIAFGLPSHPGKTLHKERDNQQYQVARAEHQTAAEPAPSEETAEAGVVPGAVSTNEAAVLGAVIKNEDGLFVEVNGEEVIISAYAESADAEPGFHAEVHGVAEAATAPYVSFCEQQSLSSDTCTHYVYDAEAHTVHPVTVDGTQLQTPYADLATGWQPDGKLLVNDHLSIDATAPWKLQALE